MRIKIEAIRPKKKQLVDISRFERGLDEALDETADEAKGMYEATYSTWSNKPTTVIRKTKYGRSVGTRSTIYKYVDVGTKPHDIRPKGPYPLRFQTGGRPKTRPNYISSYAGSQGTQWSSAKVVHHPGTDPRNFTITIQKRTKDSFSKRIKTLMREVTH